MSAYSLAQTKDIPVFDTFSQWRDSRNFHPDTVYIVNFWATWCQPCVKELPYFENFHRKHLHKPYRMILLSLDFRKQINSHLLPFLKNNDIQSEVAALTDIRYNDWMPEVNPEWSGSIPATWIIGGGSDIFVERDFDSYEDLEIYLYQSIHSLLK